MNIVHLSTFELQGGAARAAYRLHQGLLAMGKNSRILSLYSASSQDSVSQYQPPISQNPPSYYYDLIQKYCIDGDRSDISNTLFSLGYPGYDVTEHEIVKNSDIINLHWLSSGFLTPVGIRQILELEKPVVWTLHDMWAFTGGCHYSAGCDGYQQNCASCPQLREDSYKLPFHLLQDKIELFSHPNLVIVTPSRWLTQCVKNSQVFRHHRVETIPYSLDETVFYPLEKAEAKQKLNLNPDTFILLIGAMTGKEKRKGFTQLFTALKLLEKAPNIKKLINNKKLKIACFGEPSDKLEPLDIEIINFGKIKKDEDLSVIYSAANLFILPSLEDNFPNTMLEAMSCATPVISFAVGGMMDLIKDNINGVLIPAYNLDIMAQKLMELINNHEQCQLMGAKARQEIETNYALNIQAEKYVKLYQELSNKYDNQNKKTSSKLINCQDLRGNYFNKIYKDIALYSVNQELEFTRNLLREKESQIKEIKRMLSESEMTIDAMKSSKFWQWRETWFKIKQILGLR